MQHHDANGTSRRALLKTLAAAGAGAVVSASGLLAQTKSAAVTSKGRIDVHHHHRPPEPGGRGGGGGRGPQWTPERSLEAMEKFNIATALVSLTQLEDRLYDGTEKARTFARVANDYGAKMTRDYPGKFGLIASLPMPDPEGALKEVEYAYDTLKTDGISMYTSIGRRYLGDPLFVPIFDELNRHKAVIFVHPVPPICCEGLVEGMSGFAYELDFDTTRTAVSLVSSGTVTRCPDLTFIFAHSGGTLPVLAGRINDRYPNDKKYRQYAPEGAMHELQKYDFEIAHAAFPMPMAALLKFVPITHIMFGTDYPAEPMESTVNRLPDIDLTEEQRYAIDRGNAERLFPRFKIVTQPAAIPDPARQLLRHTVATLAYRGRKVVAGAPDTFAGFHAASGARTPAQILAHIGDLLDWALSIAQGEQKWHNSAPLAWSDEVRRFFAALEVFDAYLASGPALQVPAEKLFQGPIADALTHVGQLAMLRRLAGAPVRGENYFVAAIETGRVGAEQAAPRREFD